MPAESNVKEAVKDLLRLRQRILRAAKIISEESAKIVQREVIKQIQTQNLIATGDFLNSITSQVIQSPQLGVYQHSVLSSKDYAETIEDGRKPNSAFPPPDRIRKWLIIKGLESDAQTVYLVSRAIAKRGIPAKRPFAKAVAEAEPRIRTRAEIEISEALEGTKFTAEFE